MSDDAWVYTEETPNPNDPMLKPRVTPDPSTEAPSKTFSVAVTVDGKDLAAVLAERDALAARLSQTEEALEPLRALSDAATPGPWWFDGRDIFTRDGLTGHHLVVPLPDTWHESQRVGAGDAKLIVASVNAVRAALAASSAEEQT